MSLLSPPKQRSRLPTASAVMALNPSAACWFAALMNTDERAAWWYYTLTRARLVTSRLLSILLVHTDPESHPKPTEPTHPNLKELLASIFLLHLQGKAKYQGSQEHGLNEQCRGVDFRRHQPIQERQDRPPVPLQSFLLSLDHDLSSRDFCSGHARSDRGF